MPVVGEKVGALSVHLAYSGVLASMLAPATAADVSPESVYHPAKVYPVAVGDGNGLGRAVTPVASAMASPWPFIL